MLQQRRKIYHSHLNLLVIFQLIVLHCCAVDKVSIRHHLVISQPFSESDRLAEFIDSQSCLYNVNRQYEITNEEFEHINDSKYPISKMLDHLHSVISSKPEKVVFIDAPSYNIFTRSLNVNPKKLMLEL